MNIIYKSLLLIVLIITFGIGFFSGANYQKYVLYKAFDEISKEASLDLKNIVGSIENANTLEEKDSENSEIIFDKNIGDVVELATLNFKVNSIKETSQIQGDFSSPKVAKKDTFYLVVNMDVNNTTKSTFINNFEPVIKDSLDREFNPIMSIGDIEDYLQSRELQPSIIETGNIVYLLPADSKEYSLYAYKDGSNDTFKVKLK